MKHIAKTKTLCVFIGHKGNKTPTEAGMELINIPYTPKMSILDVYRQASVPEEWYNFVKR